jgi:hypothetical protein
MLIICTLSFGNMMVNSWRQEWNHLSKRCALMYFNTEHIQYNINVELPLSFFQKLLSYVRPHLKHTIVPLIFLGVSTFLEWQNSFNVLYKEDFVYKIPNFIAIFSCACYKVSSNEQLVSYVSELQERYVSKHCRQDVKIFSGKVRKVLTQ